MMETILLASTERIISVTVISASVSVLYGELSCVQIVTADDSYLTHSL